MKKHRRIPTVEGCEPRQLMSLLSLVPVAQGKVHGSDLIAAVQTTLGPRGSEAAYAVSEGTKS